MPYIDSAQGQGVSRRAISLWQAGRLSEGLGTDTDPECPCSLLIRVIPPGCPTGRLWGIFTGQCSMELWPVNCAIRCLTRRWNHAGSIGCEVAKCGSLALCMHNGPRFGPCTFSLDGGALTRLITLSLCSGLSTPGSALLPYGFGRCGQVSLLWLY